MNQQDMMPQIDMETYIPPTTQPGHLVEPLTNNLQEKVQAQSQAIQSMMDGLREQNQQHLEATKQKQLSFTMGQA